MQPQSSPQCGIRALGAGELVGRLCHVVHLIPHPDTENTSARAESGLSELHRSVLDGLGVPATVLDAMPIAQDIVAVYASVGLPLTAKAADLAVHVDRAVSAYSRAHAVDRAVCRAHFVKDVSTDRYLGDIGLLGACWHVVDHRPDDTISEPGTHPDATPLFVDGYPTTLAGYAAAELRINAAQATQVGECRAVDLFHTLGWQLTPRAQAVADLVQRAEAFGHPWLHSVGLAEQAEFDRFDHHPGDR